MTTKPEYTGPHDGFGEWLYDQYSGALYILARKYCPHTQDVDDLVQTTWAQVFLHLEDLRDKSKAEQLGYISVSVKNIVRYNARKNRVVIYPLDDVVIPDSSSIDRVEESFDRKIRHEAFQTLWQEVDEDTREILSRKYVHEETDASIAHSLGISTNSVRSYLSRARRSARVKFEQLKDTFFPNE